MRRLCETLVLMSYAVMKLMRGSFANWVVLNVKGIERFGVEYEL